MMSLLEKIFSLIIAVGYLIAVYFMGGDVFTNLLTAIIFLSMSLACIWFNETLARNYLPSPGSYGGHVVNEPSPPFLVKVVGWGLLLLPVIVLFLDYLTILK